MFHVIGEVSKGGGERGRYKYQDCLQDSNISASVRSMWAECLVVLLCSALAHSQHPVEEYVLFNIFYVLPYYSKHKEHVIFILQFSCLNLTQR